MKALAKYTLAALLLICGAATIAAQTTDNGGSSSSSIVRRGGGERGGRDKDKKAETGVSDRLAQRLQTAETSDADKMWIRVIYRDVQLDNPKNTPLYFPEEIVDGQENLFRIIMRLLAENKVPAYEYLDGKEIFTDQYRIKVADMLNRFYILYTPAKGSSEKNPTFVIDESDVPANEVLSYFLLERYEFDSRTNKTRRIVEAICPVLHRSGDFGGEAVRYPMFWVKMDDIRPYIAQQYIFVDDDNNLPKYTYADYFARNMYDGDIYKYRNLANKSMMQMYPDPDDRQVAQDSIENRLANFGGNLWVPSREEVIAAREAREAAEAEAEARAADGADEPSIASRDGDSDDDAEVTAPEPKKEVRSARTARNKASSTPAKPKKKAKAAKPKAPKSSSSSAAKSVRRRK